ncbi:ferritin-like domain-containing protein [Pedobacter arcticus]|uniref:ferritin-like domain-containing protein n=1 Tax=Pedobacter arcticus TaxID=752140 RepID=UPI000363E7A6|nr:ferritin-like domain-containing protein [Pedobacter arcticus]
MKILNIIEELVKLEVSDQSIKDRRETLKGLMGFGKKVSLASIPAVIGNLFGSAQAQTSTTNTVADSLNMLIVLEYLQYNFYNNALVNYPNLIPAADKPLFTKLRDQEKAHVDFLNLTITAAGGIPRAILDNSAFDYGRTVTSVTFTTVNTNYQNFLTAAVVLEDLTVRIYKGQLSVLFENKQALSAALKLHTAQARHSAQVRELLRNTQATDLKNLRPWVGVRRSDSGVLALLSSGNDIVTNDTYLSGVTVYDVDSTVKNREDKSVQSGMETAGFAHFTDGKTLPLTGNDLFEARAMASASFDEYFLDVSAKLQINYYLKTGFKI